MSRSYRTRPASLIAAERVARDEKGEIELPRIISRRPRAGDVHPVTPSWLERLLRSGVPVEYVYGLKRIELKARPGAVGKPFAFYSPREKTVVLYSLPPRQWRMGAWDIALNQDLARHGAEVEYDADADQCVVRWPEPGELSVWYFQYVVAHELGHHLVEKHRRGNHRWGRVADEERVASLLGSRVFRAFQRAMRDPSRRK